MRSIFALNLLFAAAISASPQTADRGTTAPQDLQTAYCPQTHQLEAEPSQKFFLDGIIGNGHVRMYLDRGGSGVVGLFFNIGGNWESTLLGGTWNNGTIEASDAAADRPATGNMNASLANNRLTGTWTIANGNQSERVELAVIPEPNCDAAQPWRHFNDPQWPVAFSYPTSWHLEQAGDGSVSLTCPNPSAIAYDQHIVIHRGSGKPDGPTHLTECGRSWNYGNACDCSQAGSHACPAAKVSRLNSATILDVSEQEHRVYCLRGGYVAAGDGEDRVVLIGDQWLEINAPADTAAVVDRLIRSLVLRKQIQIRKQSYSSR